MDIVTGYLGYAHVTAAQDRARNAGITGTGSYIYNLGEKLEATIYSNSSVRIKDGAVCHQGCVGVIATGTYDSVSVANGSQGMYRKDLIVCRYTLSANNTEELELVCIQGTATSGTPTAPSYNTGVIANGDSPVDMPLYEVNISGVNIESVTLVGQILPTTAEIESKVGSGALATSASNLIGATNETYNRTRSVFGKGTHTINRLYGVYGFIGTSGSLTLTVPLLVASDVTTAAITAIKASLRNTSGSYVYPTSDEMATLVQTVSVLDKQPLLRITLSSADFVGTNNTPVSGELISVTLVLS